MLQLPQVNHKMAVTGLIVNLFQHAIFMLFVSYECNVGYSVEIIIQYTQVPDHIVDVSKKLDIISYFPLYLCFHMDLGLMARIK